MFKTLYCWILTLLLFLSLLFSAAPAAAQTAQPETVTIPGTLQSELGCPGDWQPDCDKTFLVYDAEDDVWQGTFLVQPGNDQDKSGPRYKAAINKSWSENYGAKASAGGSDIPLVVTEPTEVKFYFDHKTRWVTDNFNSVIAVATGDFQSELGCKADNDPGCLRSWMQDIQGSGTYSFITTALPAGDYSFSVALYESDKEVYGEGNALGGAAIPFTVKNDGDEIYFAFDAAKKGITFSTEGAPKGNIAKQTAHWISKDTIAWQVVGSPKYSYALYYAPEGGMSLEASGITGGQSIPLTFASAGPGKSNLEKFPQLNGFSGLKLAEADLAKAPEILRGQVAVAAFDDKGKLFSAAGVQTAGAIDGFYTYNGPLGVAIEGGAPLLRLWAPTAHSVTLHLFADSTTTAEQTFPLSRDDATGVWSVAGKADWLNQFYLYEVEVYVPATGKVEKNVVTDPYSFSLAMNSLRSQIVDLSSAELKPQGWDALAKPSLAAFEDSVIYELHIRDFSISDASVPAELRGGYTAFTVSDSNGMKHLKGLAQAGLTHVHLLPAFDIASIDEDKATWVAEDSAKLASFPANSDQQQAAIAPYRDQDGFNWGYDPFHYTTPEGSYATNPDGSTRIVEFRQMVQSLNQAGLRVVMDVVYNHTNASGLSAKSVLDKVVPGYYHRLDGEGAVTTSTCCQNTATEHGMMEKLMIDSLVTWAKEYKVDGFRFDLMGHHMVSNMVNVRKALDALTIEKDGVDGSKILLYGEGWDFGEVASNARGKNATQLNLGGAGIATFNDRLRDAVRGGGPFNPVQEQGFATGLLDAPNDFAQGTLQAQTEQMLKYEDWIRIGLAGNLRFYKIVNAKGETVLGEQISYNGKPAAYTVDPQENITYASAHDNETIFDAIQYKAPASATIADRTRMNNLSISLVMLSQGIPFFHAGDDLLRSKSLDGNSYNSGDWFNKLDFTYQSNNWGVGLPNYNTGNWELMGKLLGDPNLKASPENIAFASQYFREMLQIRKSSPLFRLQTAEEVKAKLTFLDTGAEQNAGLIVLLLDDTQGADIDPNYDKILVLFNAHQAAVTFSDASLKDLAFTLHPLQAASVDVELKNASFDAASGAATVPGRSTAVFVLKQSAPGAAVEAEQPAAAGETGSANIPVVFVCVGAVLLALIGAVAFWLRKRK